MLIFAIHQRLILIIPILVLQACCYCDKKVDVQLPKEEKITFFVAGHVYGNPDNYSGGIYPNFLNQLKFLSEEFSGSLLFLAGDVVADTSYENWLRIENELSETNLEYYIARGNHDEGIYLNEFLQPQHYGAIQLGADWCFYLNTSNPGWTIDSLQKNWLENQLEKINPDSRIFVITHQLWWLKNTPDHFELKNIRPNSYALFDGPSDFWVDVFYLFEKIKSPVYFFSGDLGSDNRIAYYYESHHENYHFFGTGMGGGGADNFLKISIYKDRAVKIDRIDF